MINSIIFASIFYLEIKEKCDETVLESLNLFITNDITPIKDILKTEQIRRMIGYNEANSIENSNCIFYQPNTVNETLEEFNDKAFLINTLIHLQLFYHSLWLIKDNAVHSELAYVIYDDNKGTGIHSNLWTSFYTNSQGKLENVTFSVDEIKSAINLYPTILELNKRETNIIKEEIKLSSKTSSLSRGLYFVQAARTSVDIGTKVSLYCSVLESIFSVSNTELKHRLSETVAFFLENETSGKKIIYKSLQNAYDIRSAVVHGDGIPSKFIKNEAKLLLDTVKETDEIIRRCLLKILGNKNLYDLFTNKTKEEINVFLQDLIFK